MRSIEANYRKIQTQNLNMGSYLCLAHAIRGRNFTRKSLVVSFKELVPEDEYSKDDKKGLINHLEYLTNLSEEGEI